MPKVKVTPNPMFNPIGVRLLLGEIGVVGPMLQDESGITCVMTEDQISRFRNSRGAAHRIEVSPEEVADIMEGFRIEAEISEKMIKQGQVTVFVDPEPDDEPEAEDPADNEGPSAA